jgi:hypothetical protein
MICGKANGEQIKWFGEITLQKAYSKLMRQRTRSICIYIIAIIAFKYFNLTISST